MSRLKSRLAKKTATGNGPADYGFGRWYGQDTAEALVAAYEAANWVGVREHYSNLPTWHARLRGVRSINFHDEPSALNHYIASAGKKDPLAVLIRGVAGVGWAWDARGHGRAETVDEQGWRFFFERLRQADADLHLAARLDPMNPIPWVEMLSSGRGLQIHIDEIELRFENLFRRNPASVVGHSNYLQSIAGKWSGSDERMWKFALDVHSHVPAGSPLKTIVAEAYVERYIVSEEQQSSEVARIVADAADSSIFHPNFDDHDPLDQSHSLTWFATAFYYLQDHRRGASAVQKIGDKPSEWGLNYVPGNDPALRWSTLQHAFA